MTDRIAFRALLRAGAVALLEQYNASLDAPRTLTIYRGRPRTLKPPHAFVDLIRERITYGAHTHQREPVAEVVVVHGLFDSGDAVDHADAFADGFLDWVLDDYHQAHPNTLVAITEIEDIPDYVPEWIPPAEQKTYYATRFALEGLAGSG